MSLFTRAAAAAACLCFWLWASAASAAPYCAGMWIEVNGAGGTSYAAMAHDACKDGEGVGSCRAFTLNLGNPNHVCHEIYDSIDWPEFSVPYHPWSWAGCSTSHSSYYNGCYAGMRVSFAPTHCRKAGTGNYFCDTVQGVVDPDKVKGEQSACPVGNPIYPTSRNKFQAETDYVGPGPNGLVYKRYFNSLDGVWRHAYARRLKITSDVRVVAQRDHGRGFDFALANGDWYPWDDVDHSLAYDAVAAEWTLVTEDDDVEVYNAGGRLLSVTNRAGQTTTLSYLPGGALDTITDHAGRTLTLNYDTAGRIETLEDPAGNEIHYGYDTSDRLITVTYPDETPLDATDNPERTYYYENTSYPNHLTGITDENGDRYATFGYNSSGEPSFTEHAGGVDRYDVDYLSGSLVEITNPLGKTSEWTLAVKQGERKITAVDGNATTLCAASSRSISYDAEGYRNEVTDELGHTTDYDHNSRGLVTSKTEAKGTADERTTTTSWHADFRVPTQIVEPGRTTTFTYDSSGRMLTRTITDNQTQTVPYTTTNNTRTWTYTYNSHGLVASVNGPRTDVTDTTTYTYDTNGNLTHITNALSQVTEITARDARGLPTELEDVNGVVTELAYDARGRLATRTVKSSQGDAVTSFEYDDVGQLTQFVLPDSSELNYEYDAAHRLEAIENGSGERIEYTLDDAGNRTAEVIKDSGSTIRKSMTRVFDELSRLREDLGANSQSTDLSYDVGNNLTASEDGLSRVTGQSYDALDRLIEITDPATHDTDLAYDDRDNLTSVVDPIGVTTSYVYDGLDNLIQESSPDAGTTVYEYDAAGNLTEKTDGRSVVTEYSYDALNRLTAVTYPGSTGENVSYSYDTGTNGVGRLRSVTDESGTTTFSYDDRGNLTSRSWNTGTQTFVTSYSYDLADNIATVTYPSGRVVTYSRDGEGRVDGVTGQVPGGSVETLASSISHKPFGPMDAWTSGNGVTNDRSFDQDYRVTDIEITAASLIHDTSYTYNVVDQITALNDAINTSLNQAFDYDLLDRLDEADGDYGDQSYSYDANGNRTQRYNATTLTTQTLTYATGTNQLATVDSAAVVQDGAGNRTSDSGSTRVYSYNHAGRMIRFTDSSVVQADYVMNAEGQRVTKERHVGAATYVRHFFYDQSGRLLGEYLDNPDGSYGYIDYVWLEGTPLVQEERSFNSSDVLTGTQETWLHVDHLNTPRIGTDDTQMLVWRWDSDPFGVGAPDEDPDSDSTDHVVNLRFPGQYADEETGLNYNYFRTYDPLVGRYTQDDPVGLKGGPNRFAYVDGNPTRYIDTYGLDATATLSRGLAVWGGASLIDGPAPAGEVLGGVAFLGFAGYAAYEALSAPHDPTDDSEDVNPQSCPLLSPRDACDEGFRMCLASSLQSEEGPVWGTSRCTTCRDQCVRNDGVWPDIAVTTSGRVRCDYWNF